MSDEIWEDENERSWHATVSDFITEITELEAERDTLKNELAREKRSCADLYRSALSANNSLRVEVMMARAERDELTLRLDAMISRLNQAMLPENDGLGPTTCFFELVAMAEGRNHG